MSKALFDVVRAIKGAPLSQADVDAINAALAPVAPPAAKRVSPEGIALIHSFESCKLTAYPDPGSVDGKPWTIGWGSTGPGIAKGVVWTQEQADARFAADLGRFEKAVALMAPVTTQNQFDALVSFAYNVGVPAFCKSTMAKQARAGQFTLSCAQFDRWTFIGNKDCKVRSNMCNGIVIRRAEERALCEGINHG